MFNKTGLNKHFLLRYNQIKVRDSPDDNCINSTKFRRNLIVRPINIYPDEIQCLYIEAN